MRFLLICLSCLLLFALGVLAWASHELRSEKMVYYPTPSAQSWTFQAIDTMKYSRDLAREKRDNPAFEIIIKDRVRKIADTGATHVAIATPYDEEFLPFLKKWVEAARENGLKVWFRGNWSGWEGWFEYPRIGRDDHIEKTKKFILDNPDLFEDGDAFSSCPECENGGPGDPRNTGDVEAYRAFLIAEYRMMREAFREIDKSIRANLFSMNGDVARLVMDVETTKALDGIVTIDHYVESPVRLALDVEEYARLSQGKIILGEFGAPIPDIHGAMTQSEQAAWIDDVMRRMEASEVVEGMNYWLSTGGTTAIWDSTGKETPSVQALTRHYNTVVAYGFVRDELGRAIAGARIRSSEHEVSTNENGYFILRYSIRKDSYLYVEADQFDGQMIVAPLEAKKIDFVLKRRYEDFEFRLLSIVKRIID